MSKPIVPTITDDLIAEFEAKAKVGWRSVDGINLEMVLALLAERAELKLDAERYRWLCNGHGYFMEENMLCNLSNDKPEADNTIDAAMQEQQK